MKSLIILGSTGSIGQQTIEVVERYPDLFRVVGLSTRGNTVLLKEQAKKIKPLSVAVADINAAVKLSVEIGAIGAQLLGGPEGIINLCRLAEADTVVNALVGSVGLKPTLATLEEGKNLLLSNKESLVVGGEIVTKLAKEKKVMITPIDSEHSAIFQCLRGEKKSQVKKIIITGSGGPFRGRKKKDLKNVTVKEALAHPRWKMGTKITIDSATLMNKGLEVIEAHFLFDVDYDSIKVVIHPQSIVHSLVEFVDGSVLAQLGPTDMRLPIQYALTYPERVPSPVTAIDLVELGELDFEEPDLETFPCLKLSYEAGKAGKTYPAVLNVANEEAVEAFLAERIGFLDISEIVYKALERHKGFEPDLRILEEAQMWAREKAQEEIERIENKR
ncbi:MAG: 1-deoxy-D-xylulose-5-phosphate reductoisomerase [Actinomycetota bacterium]